MGWTTPTPRTWNHLLGIWLRISRAPTVSRSVSLKPRDCTRCGWEILDTTRSTLIYARRSTALP
ncbi:hypothetical protein DPMN_005035 [Dreissena polymorpha]|uniref:Uncharacterized protein n=1 Tax=Dreissena polymorpha TaxID=45954 RepID=A0A9D4RW65_DREPO|nr:hypothetical protein DPMN_005035 [Dreissena polymorpha]